MKNTKYFSLVLFLTIAATTSAIVAGGIITSMHAESRGSQIVLTWQTVDESGIHSFGIERKSDAATNFLPLYRIQAKGRPSSYEFIDNSAFSRSLSYRIKVVGNGIEQYGPTYTVSHEVASVKRSWGMIKELFR